MTEIAGTQRRKRLSTRVVTLRLVAASLMAIAGGLAIQMANGHDPALGAATSTAQSGSGTGSTGDDGSNTASTGDDGSDGIAQSAPSATAVTTRSS
jgi:hypothetical protein